MRFRAWMLPAFALAAIAAPLRAQPCNPPECGALEIEVRSAGPYYGGGQPVLYDVAVENLGSEPVSGVSIRSANQLNWRFDATAPECAGTNAAWRRFEIQSPPYFEDWRLDVGTLAPGARHEVQFCGWTAEKVPRELSCYVDARYFYVLVDGVHVRDSSATIRWFPCDEICDLDDGIHCCPAEFMHCLLHPEDLDCLPYSPVASSQGTVPRTWREGLGALRAAAALVSHPGDLARLRALRHTLLPGTPGGRRAIELYDRHGDEIKSLLAADPVLFGLAADALDVWRPGIRALLDHRGATLRVNEFQSAALETLLDRLAATGSPALAAMIAGERAAIGLDSFEELTLDEALRRLDRFRCEANERVQCAHGGRFRVETSWERFDGSRGDGRAVPLTGDSGYFWFFDDANVELVSKIVDGCDLTGSFWFFAGGLTNVEVRTTLTDTVTGATKSYLNPLSTPFSPILDTAGLAVCDAALPTPAILPRPPERMPASLGGCVPSPTRLCLLDGRFEASLDWRAFDGRAGAGQAVALTGDSGTFWFFDAENVEVVVKMVDGCGTNDRHWVFATGLTNVGRAPGARHLERRVVEPPESARHAVPADPRHRGVRRLSLTEAPWAARRQRRAATISSARWPAG